jgi:hypothetical protein
LARTLGKVGPVLPTGVCVHTSVLLVSMALPSGIQSKSSKHCSIVTGCYHGYLQVSFWVLKTCQQTK